MEITQIYDKAFYDAQAQESYKSAINLLPCVNEIFAPKSVVDIGCGVGTWLKAWVDINPHIRIAGVDGNEVDSQMYFIPSECYKRVDLTQYHATLSNTIIEHFTGKMGGGREPNSKPFDLAQSLEVAEHLDECYADNFVALLTSLSNIILFSAAIPYQGGTHHINCQPPTYWAKKFAQYDFECYDILRMKFWDNNAIASWYRQNSLIFIHKSKRGLFANFTPTQNPAHLMHPNMWESYIKYLEQEAQRWRKKYNKTLPKRLERLFKSLRAKIRG